MLDREKIIFEIQSLILKIGNKQEQISDLNEKIVLLIQQRDALQQYLDCFSNHSVSDQEIEMEPEDAEPQDANTESDAVIEFTCPDGIAEGSLVYHMYKLIWTYGVPMKSIDILSILREKGIDTGDNPWSRLAGSRHFKRTGFAEYGLNEWYS